MRIRLRWLSPLLILLSACSTTNSHTNLKSTATPGPPIKTRLAIDDSRSRDGTLFILALSGGGSRAAYLSTRVMFRLQNLYAADGLDMLSRVDAISSVSGGSLPAAYYAISTDPGEPRLHGRVWEEQRVGRLMRKNYIARWFGNWFWPYNIGRFWFTAYDRTDIMAQTFADNLFDDASSGRDLTLADINPERPWLVLNATNGTEGQFGEPFTFTGEDFARLGSDAASYELSRAVMATATFPAVFNYMTLRNYAAGDGGAEYIHVFDGGNYDNLGLKSVLRMLDTARANGVEFERLVVVLVDAYTDAAGVNSKRPDTRGFFDFIVDTNFIDATDSLLTANRSGTLNRFHDHLRHNYPASKSVFYHIRIADLTDTRLRDAMNRIKTDFRLRDGEAETIDAAVASLMSADNPCLVAIRRLLEGRDNAGPQRCPPHDDEVGAAPEDAPAP
ncbi:MAG TPA: patatin-like phospholipase family protein [Gammaproteobacteria bacterium]|nr:patatin-like phospholipase family protein [Gammaproteobacteria bacterium]